MIALCPDEKNSDFSFDFNIALGIFGSVYKGGRDIGFTKANRRSFQATGTFTEGDNTTGIGSKIAGGSVCADQ